VRFEAQSMPWRGKQVDVAELGLTANSMSLELVSAIASFASAPNPWPSWNDKRGTV
jgi:hypothetical protein